MGKTENTYKENTYKYYLHYDETDAATRKVMDEVFDSTHHSYWLEKRAFDIVCALGALIVFAIPMLLVAIGIIIDDPHGSPIFKQVRIGRHGKPFHMYKFRSMVVNAEALKESLKDQNEADEVVFKIKNDPRITRFGKIIRATSLDELPQFFNVLKGDMCIVGPRPPLPNEVEQYTDLQKIRLSVTPGIVCTWQLADNRNDIPFEKWVEMDIEYIKTRSYWLDMKLILGTIPVMLKHQGR